MRSTPTSERRQRLIALLLLAFCIDGIGVVTAALPPATP
jgi:hypothetical protein